MGQPVRRFRAAVCARQPEAESGASLWSEKQFYPTGCRWSGRAQIRRPAACLPILYGTPGTVRQQAGQTAASTRRLAAARPDGRPCSAEVEERGPKEAVHARRTTLSSLPPACFALQFIR
jgi:hypothetical protein